MTKDQIKQRLVVLISNLFADKQMDLDVIEYLDLFDDLGMDSITFVSMIIEVESEFNIIIPDELLLFEQFKCVDNIVLIVETELTKAAEVDDDKA